MLIRIFLSSVQLDLPFSIPFYRWLLYEENALTLSDLAAVAPEVQVTLKRLQNIVRERDEIMADPSTEEDTKNAKVSFRVVSRTYWNRFGSAGKLVGHVLESA